MAIGNRIQRIRNFRGMSQRQLGIAIGLNEETARGRIAQYESGVRTPKEDLLKKIAEVLDVNYRVIYEPTLTAAEDVMYFLYELDELYSIGLHEVEDTSDPNFPKEHIAVSFNYSLLDNFMKEWMQRKKDLANGTISKEEYLEWKINWPQTADDCGKFEPSKKWRKE